MQMHCPSCGLQVYAQTKFCPQCGATVLPTAQPWSPKKTVAVFVVTLLTLPIAALGACVACAASGMGTEQAIHSLPQGIRELLPAGGEILTLGVGGGSFLLVFCLWIWCMRKLFKH